MASKIFNEFKDDLFETYLASGADLRVALLMSNTTADTANDGIVNLDDLTLDECDSTNYSRQALSSEASNKDDANDRAELDSADITFASLGQDASRTIVGALLYEHVDGTDANDKVVAFYEFSSAVPTTASEVNLTVNAEGLIQIT